MIARDYKTNNQAALGFVEELRKHLAPEKTAQKAQQLLQKALKGDASGVKGKVGNSDIPKEAVAIVTGLQTEAIFTVAVDWLPGNKYEVEGINEMNALELACVSGSVKLVQFLVEDCNLRSCRDF